MDEARRSGEPPVGAEGQPGAEAAARVEGRAWVLLLVLLLLAAPLLVDLGGWVVRELGRR